MDSKTTSLTNLLYYNKTPTIWGHTFTDDDKKNTKMLKKNIHVFDFFIHNQIPYASII